MYRQVLKIYLFGEINALRAKTPERLPTVLTVDETFAVIDAMSGTHQLMAKVLYGSGLRGIECVRLRVKDIVFGLNQILVHNAKGNKDRTGVFPDDIKPTLREHLRYVMKLHEKDLNDG